MIGNHKGTMTTESFAGVVNLGRIDNVGRLRVATVTDLVGSPYKYTSVQTAQNYQENGCRFRMRGCGCSKRIGRHTLQGVALWSKKTSSVMPCPEEGLRLYPSRRVTMSIDMQEQTGNTIQGYRSLP
jgi:hypothetical protein